LRAYAVKDSGDKKFWFSTDTSGTKVRHFKHYDQSGVAFYNGLTLLRQIYVKKAFFITAYRTTFESKKNFQLLSLILPHHWTRNVLISRRLTFDIFQKIKTIKYRIEKCVL